MYESDIQSSDGYDFVDVGPREGETIVLLHGLFGTASNFEHLIEAFRSQYRIVLPILPIFTAPLKEVSLKGMLEYVMGFLDRIGVGKFHLIGNSLGGHVALLYLMTKQHLVQSLTLTGSSGLYEKAFGSSMPKRNSEEYVREKIKLTFYDEAVVTDEMVREVYQLVNNRLTALRIVKMAKSAIRHNMEKELSRIKIPTLLVWGKQDTITPPFVGEKFNEYIGGSELHLLDKCGHAPMLERPNEFNSILRRFLQGVEL